jgi:hypothetical protein
MSETTNNALIIKHVWHQLLIHENKEEKNIFPAEKNERKVFHKIFHFHVSCSFETTTKSHNFFSAYNKVKYQYRKGFS